MNWNWSSVGSAGRRQSLKGRSMARLSQGSRSRFVKRFRTAGSSIRTKHRELADGTHNMRNNVRAMRRNSKSTGAAGAPSAIGRHIGTPIARSPIRLHTPFALRVFGAALILVLLSSATQPGEHAVHGGLLLVANKCDHVGYYRPKCWTSGRGGSRSRRYWARGSRISRWKTCVRANLWRFRSR